MRKVREVIVVEGRYDKNTVLQAVDASVITLGGFAVFNDREKLEFLRRLAEERGIIILTDSDGAGFTIRNYLKSAIPKEQIKQAYIPDIYGKEKRKRRGGKEGKLGVEGMRPEVLLRALEQAGATFESGAEFEERTESSAPKRTPVTKADLVAWGLSGGEKSAEKRKVLLHKLNLPEHLNANAMLEAINLLYGKEGLAEFLSSEND